MLIRVKVETGSKREAIRQVSETSFAVSVREDAQENRANNRIVALLAEYFQVPSKSVRIVKGHHARSKILDVATS